MFERGFKRLKEAVDIFSRACEFVVRMHDVDLRLPVKDTVNGLSEITTRPVLFFDVRPERLFISCYFRHGVILSLHPE